MIDVHPPEHTPHSWRDFFVHIATIVVGLCIAVGLEQTVEAIHYHYERRALIADMHTEAENNLPIIDSDIQRAEGAKRWARQAIAVVTRATPAADQTVIVTLPAGTIDIEGDQPSRAMWDIAKANGKAALVPDNYAEMYDRQKWEADGSEKAVDKIISDHVEFNTLQARLQTPIAAGATLHLTAPERDELLRLLATNVASASNLQYWLAAWGGAAEAITHGAHSRTEFDTAINHRHAELPK
jgi:hypothetical protein